MIVETLDWGLTSEDFSEAEGQRSPGLHVSKIIMELNEARGNTYAPADEATRQIYFTLGFIWEIIIANIIRDTAIRKSNGMLQRPGELFVDGIALSPDAVDLGDYALEEYKATWLSSKNDIDGTKFWHWIVQMKCYCRALGTRRARLRVLFVVGDWRGSGPQVRAWQFEFTEREIEENWAMVINHARYRGWI
jgi:hypothetical protein